MAQNTYTKAEFRRFLKRTISGLAKAYYGGHISGKVMVELSTKFERMMTRTK